MLFRLVRATKRSGSSRHQFVQRIPRDIKSRAVGMRLRIPLGDAFVEKTISPKAEDIRFSLGTANPPEVKLRHAAATATSKAFGRASAERKIAAHPSSSGSNRRPLRGALRDLHAGL